MAEKQLERMREDLEGVSDREKVLKETTSRLSRELSEERSKSATAETQLSDVRKQLTSLQEAIKSKDDLLAELRSNLKEGTEVRLDLLCSCSMPAPAPISC